MANNTNKIMIIAIVLLLSVGYMVVQKPTEIDTSIGITFRTRSAEGIKLALVGGEHIPGAEGQFGVTVGNEKVIPIQSVSFTSKDDAKFDSTFDSTAFPFQSVAELAPSTSTPETNTDWFDLEWYATNHPGTTRFTFNFDYNYMDAEGILHPNVPSVGFADIEIFGDTCTDSTAFGQCNGDGEVCEYASGSGAVLTETETCCASAGGVWQTDTCVFTCGSVPLGACETNPGTLPAKNTYCDPSTAVMVEDCGQCSCYDYFGNSEASCNVEACVFTDYGIQNVIVNVVDVGQTA